MNAYRFKWSSCIFQFTTSQGGRLYCVRGTRTRLFFQFTTSQGGRPMMRQHIWIWHILSIHDLTRRSTLSGSHKSGSGSLSIHDLTRRSTCSGNFLFCGFFLSIHDLTRRSTIFPSEGLYSALLSIHDLTRRSTIFKIPVIRIEPFQFTTSQGGRHFFDTIAKVGTNLSIHDLTRRSTVSL